MLLASIDNGQKIVETLKHINKLKVIECVLQAWSGHNSNKIIEDLQ